MASVSYQGRTYQIGMDPRHQPLPLPDWIPTVLPAGWQEVHTGAWTGGVSDREYARAYKKHDTVLVLMSCATQTDGKRWLHVSVSRRNKEIPTWQLMCEIKDVFIGPERTALQVMPPRSQWVSIHPGCLHLWACLDDLLLPDFRAGGQTL